MCPCLSETWYQKYSILPLIYLDVDISCMMCVSCCISCKTGSAVHVRYQCYTTVCIQNLVHNVQSPVAYISYLALPDTSTERDLQKVLQQLEPQISFLEELTKMGGAMRTVLTKILTNQQTFKELSMGKYLH